MNLTSKLHFLAYGLKNGNRVSFKQGGLTKTMSHLFFQMLSPVFSLQNGVIYCSIVEAFHQNVIFYQKIVNFEHALVIDKFFYEIADLPNNLNHNIFAFISQHFLIEDLLYRLPRLRYLPFFLSSLRKLSFLPLRLHDILPSDAEICLLRPLKYCDCIFCFLML